MAERITKSKATEERLARNGGRRLPSIAVEEETIRTRLDVPEPLLLELEAYARYFAAATGRKPRSMNDVILGIVEDYVRGDPDFARWQRENPHTITLESPFSAKADPRASAPS